MRHGADASPATYHSAFNQNKIKKRGTLVFLLDETLLEGIGSVEREGGDLEILFVI